MSMAFLRRRLTFIVCIWLAGQAAGLATAPFALCCKTAPGTSVHDDEEECCPGLLPGQVCPMHHTKEGVRTCKMRSACSSSDAALVLLSGGLGVLPEPTVTVSAFELRDGTPVMAPSAIARVLRPESPPPKI
jgi:hypothetical protein